MNIVATAKVCEGEIIVSANRVRCPDGSLRELEWHIEPRLAAFTRDELRQPAPTRTILIRLALLLLGIVSVSGFFATMFAIAYGPKL